MELEIVQLPLGMTMTNAYLAAEASSKRAVVIDPGFEGQRILEEADKREWKIEAIWLTHAHFDHLGAAGEVAAGLPAEPPVALHPEDEWLWKMDGGAALFGMGGIDPGPEPRIWLTHGQMLTLGEIKFEVRHAPGHTPGHVMFYCPSEAVLFCGDVIFQSSIGRTDLPRGSYAELLKSIHEQVLDLPDETRLLNGHGPQTTVGRERTFNPFL
ncbi:MAG: MBL fold metallo-hydrolase [Anaerolineales bacterium]|jgi:glyoxylase-like metal-dependent hydrolase (beta-lactamase superfamily II)